MAEILLHFFTNNHMQRAFSFFRLISWKVSVSLSQSLGKSDCRAHQFYLRLFSLFSSDFALDSSWRSAWKRDSDERSGECKKGKEMQRDELRSGRKKGKLFAKMSVNFCTFHSKASRWRLNLNDEAKTAFHQFALREPKLLHQHKFTKYKVVDIYITFLAT